MEEPDKWCIKVTPENKEAIEKWRTASAISGCNGYCVNKTSFNSSIGYWYLDKPSGYTEISFEEFKVYTSKPEDLTGRYVKCLVDGAQGTKCKAGEIYKLVSLDNTVETQVYKLEDGLCLCISPTTTDKWELLPEDYSADKPLIQVVHCKTQEEWDFVSNRIGYKFITEFELGRNDTINPLSQGCESKSFFERHGKYNLLSFQEWCDLNGYKMEKEVKFEVGKWYRVTDGTCKAIGKNIWYAKSPKLIDNIIICEEYIHKKINKGGNFGELGEYTFTEVSIEEIQQYLPDGHPNKIKTVQSFEAGKWYKKDGYYLKPKKIIGTNSQCNTEYISPEGKYHANNSGIDDLRTWELLTDLTEIQQYLPNGHPDKFREVVFKSDVEHPITPDKTLISPEKMEKTSKNDLITRAVKTNNPQLIADELGYTIEEIVESENSTTYSCVINNFNLLRGAISCSGLDCTDGKCPFRNSNEEAISWLRSESKPVSPSESELERWLRETKAKNLSLEELEYKIDYKVSYSEVYKKLQGNLARGKAQILYKKCNVKQERDWTKATKEERLEEAKKRYPKGTKFRSAVSNNVYVSNGSAIALPSSRYPDGIVNYLEPGLFYASGKWAEIISEGDIQLQDSCFNPSNNSGTITMNYTKSEPKRLLLEIDDEELPMVPIIYSKTVDIMKID